MNNSLTETSQQSRVETELRNWTRRFVQLIDLIFLRYKYSIFYRLEISGGWNEAEWLRAWKYILLCCTYIHNIYTYIYIWLLSIVCQLEMKQRLAATLKLQHCYCYCYCSCYSTPNTSTSRLDLKRNLCSVESHYLEWFYIFLSTFSLTDLRRDCMGPPCRSMSS